MTKGGCDWTSPTTYERDLAEGGDGELNGTTGSPQAGYGDSVF
jgi:hypothetical protein